MKLVYFSLLIIGTICFAFSQNKPINQTQFDVDSLRFFTSDSNNLQLIFNNSIVKIDKDSFFLNPLSIKKSNDLNDFNSKNYLIVKGYNDNNFFARSDMGEVFSIKKDSLIRNDFSKQSKAFTGANMIFHQNSIYSFFGYGFFEERNAVTQFDFESKQWNKVIIDKDSYQPEVRRHSIHHKKGNQVYFLGGTNSNLYQSNNHLLDLMTFDFSDKKFSKIGTLKNDFTFFNNNQKNIIHLDDNRSLFFKKDIIYLVDFELLKYRFLQGVSQINDYHSKVVHKDTLYYLDIDQEYKFEIKNIALLDLLENFSEPYDLLEKVYVTQKTRRNILLLALIALFLFITIRLFNLRKFKNIQILKQDQYITFKNIIIPLTVEESEIIDFLIIKLTSQLNEIFELDVFNEYSDSYVKIYVPKVIDELKRKIENKSNDSDFKLKIAFGKNKFDKRIKEISLKGDIKIYNGWFFYIFNF